MIRIKYKKDKFLFIVLLKTVYKISCHCPQDNVKKDEITTFRCSHLPSSEQGQQSEQVLTIPLEAE